MAFVVLHPPDDAVLTALAPNATAPAHAVCGECSQALRGHQPVVCPFCRQGLLGPGEMVQAASAACCGQVLCKRVSVTTFEFRFCLRAPGQHAYCSAHGNGPEAERAQIVEAPAGLPMELLQAAAGTVADGNQDLHGLYAVAARATQARNARTVAVSELMTTLTVGGRRDALVAAQAHRLNQRLLAGSAELPAFPLAVHPAPQVQITEWSDDQIEAAAEASIDHVFRSA